MRLIVIILLCVAVPLWPVRTLAGVLACKVDAVYWFRDGVVKRADYGQSSFANGVFLLDLEKQTVIGKLEGRESCSWRLARKGNEENSWIWEGDCGAVDHTVFSVRYFPEDYSVVVTDLGLGDEDVGSCSPGE